MEKMIKNLLLLEEKEQSIYRINKRKQGLPQEIQEMKKELAALLEKKAQCKEQATQLEEEIKERKAESKVRSQQLLEIKSQISKTKEQDLFDKLNRDLELCNVELLLNKKKSHALQKKLIETKVEIENVEKKRGDTIQILEEKEEALKEIDKKYNEQERAEKEEKERIVNELNPVLYQEYIQIKQLLSPLPAVTGINEKGACSSCSLLLPKQQAIDLIMNQSIKRCDHCGALLVYAQSVDVKEEKTTRRRTTRSKKSAE